MILSPFNILERNLDGTRHGVLLGDNDPRALSLSEFRDIARAMLPGCSTENTYMDVIFTQTGRREDDTLLAFFKVVKKIYLESGMDGSHSENDDEFWAQILAEGQRQLDAQNRNLEQRFDRDDAEMEEFAQTPTDDEIEVTGTIDGVPTPPREGAARFEYLGDGRWDARFRNERR